MDGDPLQLDNSMEELRKMDNWTRFLTPAPYMNYQTVPGGNLIELIKAASNLEFSFPFLPILELTDVEKQKAKTFLGSLPTGKKILIETEFSSDQTHWKDFYASDILNILGADNPVLIFSAKNKPVFYDDLKLRYDNVFWFNQELKLNAEIYNNCDAYIGVSSGISSICSSSYCRMDLPHLEISRGFHWSSAIYPEKEELYLAYSYSRFIDGLYWIKNKLFFFKNFNFFAPKFLKKITSDNNMETVPCLMCGENSFSYARGNDVVRCNACGNVYLKYRLSKTAMEKHYSEKYAVNDPHAAPAVRLPASIDLIDTQPDFIGAQRREVLERIQKMFGLDLKDKVLIDIGCGWGAFLHNARKFGMRVLGYEFTKPNVDYGKRVLNLDIREQQFIDADDIEENSVDFIIMNHSLEHVPYPFEFLEKINQVLKPDGIFFCMVPNFDSFLSDVLQDNWLWIEREVHYTQFTPNTFKHVLPQAGFYIEKLFTTTGDYGEEVPISKLKEFYPDQSDLRYKELLTCLNNMGKGEQINVIARKRGSSKSRVALINNYDTFNINSTSKDMIELKSQLEKGLSYFIDKVDRNFTIFNQNYLKLFDYYIFNQRAEFNQVIIAKFIAQLMNISGKYHFLYGGAGDILLALSIFYDYYNNESIICIPNSINAIRSLLECFPKLKNILILPRSEDYIVQTAKRTLFGTLQSCKSRGLTPLEKYEMEWVDGIDIFHTYNVIEHPEWVKGFKGNRMSNPQVVIAPRGSVYGMPDGKKNIIPEENWFELLFFLIKKNINPIIIGTPDERNSYPLFSGCIDKRSYSFKEQMEIIASADLVIAADSWHKTFSALAGVRTIVFRAISEGLAKNVDDVSENVFLHQWKDITVVNDYFEFLDAFSETHFDETEKERNIESVISHINEPAKQPKILSSYSFTFWGTNYTKISSVLIIPTTAVGDNLMLTALVADLKSQFEHLDIYIHANYMSLDIFKGHPCIKGFINNPEERKFDKIINYHHIIAGLPEYFNGIHFMAILGNLAGIRFNKRNIVYQLDYEETVWAKNELKHFEGQEIVGVHFTTSKDIKRSYPHGNHLLRSLISHNPRFRFVLLGNEPMPGLDNSYIYDATQFNSIRKQIALAGLCEKFISIDSAFFHVGHNLFNKPTLAILGLTNPALIGNSEKGYAYIRNETLSCLNCYWTKECHIECMELLMPESVAAEFLAIEEKMKLEPNRIVERLNIKQGENFEHKIYDYFVKTKKGRLLEINDMDGILPDYAVNWNGIRLTGEKWSSSNYDDSDNEFYVESIFGKPEQSGFDIEDFMSISDKKIMNTEKLHLNLGCGRDIRDDFVNIDLSADDDRVLKADAGSLPYPDESADLIIATNLLEYFSQKEIQNILKEWVRVLKIGCELIIEVPSFRLINSAYQNGEIQLNTLSMLIFGDEKHSGTKQSIFDENYLKKQIEKTGLRITEIVENIDTTIFKYNIRFKTVKPENYLQLKIHEAVQLGMDFTEKPVYENLPQKVDFEHTPRLNIVWEGSQFVFHSLALINREHSSNLIDSGLVELTIVPYEDDKFEPDGNSKYEKLAKNDIRYKAKSDEKTAKLPYLWIRHQWPPKDQVPLGAKWVIMQPWEYSTLPKRFVDIFKQADEIWTPSVYSRQCFINSGLPFDKVQVVPNGIDPKLFSPDGEKYPLNTQKKLKLLFVGGTIFRKGIDILLQSYIKTFGNQDDICLVIKDMGGDSFYRGQNFKDEIAKIHSTPEAPEVIYLDSVMSEEEIVSLYRSCDVFVSPYRGEGFSLPTLEAMACGLPVIVPQGGPTDDFVDETTGWLVSASKRSIGNAIDNQPLTGEAFVLEPNQQELSEILKSIYERPDSIFSKGLTAMLRARTKWTWKLATIQLFSRVDALYGTHLAREAEQRLRDNVDDYILLAKASEEFNNQQNDAALNILKEVLSRDEIRGRYLMFALNLAAYIYISKGMNDESADCVDRALQISDNPDSRFIDALILSNEGNQSDALDIFTKLFDSWNEVKYRTTIGLTLDLLLCETADIFLEQEDTEGALKLYTAALKYNDANYEACYGSAKCFLTVGAKEEAEKMLEWAIGLNPDFQEARELLETIN